MTAGAIWKSIWSANSVPWCISNCIELVGESGAADIVCELKIWGSSQKELFPENCDVLSRAGLIWLERTAGAIWRSIWSANSGQKRTYEALKKLVLQAELLSFSSSNFRGAEESISLRAFFFFFSYVLNVVDLRTFRQMLRQNHSELEYKNLRLYSCGENTKHV